MKSKKLFAILTLVAFMMTLVPAFAFAGEDAVANYSASGSSVEVVDDAIEVYNDEDGEYAQITLTFNYRGEGVYGTVYFYAKADNDDLVGYVATDDEATSGDPIEADDISKGIGQLFEVNIPEVNDGEVYFFVNSYEVGDLEIVFYDGPADLENYPDSRRIGTAEIAIEASDDALLTLEAELDDYVSKNIVDNKVKVNLSSDAGLKASVDNNTAEDESGFYEIAKIEFGDEITLTATVKDKANTKLKDEIVVFKKSVNGGSFTTIAEVATDKNGIAELEVEEERTGQYRYQAVLKSDKTVKSSAMDDYYFTWTANGVAKIVAKTEDGTKVALKEDYKLQFYLYDGNGNLIKGDGSKADLIVEDSPKGSKVKDIKDQEVDSNGIVSFVVNLDKEGTYEFTVEPGDGRGELDFTVECQEFDEAVEMVVELSDDRPSVVCVGEGTSTGTSIVATLIDEDGVEKKISDGTGLKFGSSNRAAVTVGPTGDIVVEDEDFVGTVTITVIDTDSGVNADYELNVVGVPVSFEPVVTVNGKKAAVELQYLDKNGARTYGGNDKLTLILPSGVSSEAVEDFDEDTGIASFDLVATKAGEYTIIANSDIGITKSFKVAFEVPASEKVVKGAENVTMFIGNAAYVQDGVAKVTDVAPFIKDNRTFVAIRPVADAFGCEIGWDEATQTVTLTRDDLTVTIVIGSSDILVVKDGVTTTVTADVPAFIQDGRTVLPFRAIGNAFGATVNYDAATQSVSYVQE